MKAHQFSRHLYWVKNNNKILKVTATITTQIIKLKPPTHTRHLLEVGCRNVCTTQFYKLHDVPFLDKGFAKALYLISEIGRIYLTRERLIVPPPIESWTVLITFWAHLGLFSDSTRPIPSPRTIYITIARVCTLPPRHPLHSPTFTTGVGQALQMQAAQLCFEFSKIKPGRQGLVERVCFEQLEFICIWIQEKSIWK